MPPLDPRGFAPSLSRSGGREEGKASRIKKFDGTNFGYWRMQIEDYLYRKKLHLPLLGMKPKTMKDEE